MNVQPVKIPINFVNEPRSTNKGVKTELQQPVNDKKSRPELQRPVNGVKSCPEFHIPQELIDQLEDEQQKQPLKNEAKLDIMA